MKCSPLLRILCLLAAVAAAFPTLGEDVVRRTLITNVNVFDGTSDGLLANASVLVENNMIAAVSVDPIEATCPAWQECWLRRVQNSAGSLSSS